jgi:hypothetical protein
MRRERSRARESTAMASGQQEGGRVRWHEGPATAVSGMVRWEAVTRTDLQTRRNGSTATVRRRYRTAGS